MYYNIFKKGGGVLLKKIALICLSMMLILTGCSYSQSGIEEMLQPPRLSQQQNQIYSALEATVGSNIKLKYPRKGDFTSAFLLNNIDGEYTQEAIVFFQRIGGTASTTAPIRLNVLDQKDGDWVSTCEIVVEASEVEKVNFVNFNEKTYIIVGFNLYNKTEKLVKLYSFDGSMLHEMFSLSCSNYEVVDLDDDGQQEIVAIITKEAEPAVKTVNTVVYSIGSGGLLPLTSAPMDPTVSDYIQIAKGKLETGETALYLDGLKGTVLSTEILVLDDNHLRNLVYHVKDKVSLINTTVRPYGSFCMDLNNDGVYEIPQLVPALGYEEAETHQKLYFTQWYTYQEQGLKLGKTSYVDYQLGYLFALPDKWVDRVTIEQIINEDEIIFYEYQSDEAIENTKLASIRVVRKGEYSSRLMNDGYHILKENGQLIFLYQIHASNSPLKPTISDIENSFLLIS